MLQTIVNDLTTYLHQGGFVMGPLVVGTLVLWYALGYRYATLRRGNKRSVRVLVDRYAADYDRPPQGIIDTAIVRGLQKTSNCPGSIRRFLDETFAPFEKDVSKYSTLVRSIVAAAPLAGLLGTVTGMIETFDALGDMTLFSQSGGVAGGISQALISTQMGLAVAVPGMVIGRMLDRRQKQIEFELAQIKDILCAKECDREEASAPGEPVQEDRT